jgi:hypothetical protein
MPHTPISDLRWNALLNDFRKSGLTHAAFCQLRDISLHTFRKRLYQAPSSTSTSRRTTSPAVTDPAFLPVTVLADPPRTDSTPHQPLELILSRGRRLAIAPGFDAHTLRRLLTVLEGPPCSE